MQIFTHCIHVEVISLFLVKTLARQTSAVLFHLASVSTQIANTSLLSRISSPHTKEQETEYLEFDL